MIRASNFTFQMIIEIFQSLIDRAGTTRHSYMTDVMGMKVIHERGLIGFSGDFLKDEEFLNEKKPLYPGLVMRELRALLHSHYNKGA